MGGGRQRHDDAIAVGLARILNYSISVSMNEDINDPDSLNPQSVVGDSGQPSVQLLIEPRAPIEARKSRSLTTDEPVKKAIQCRPK